MQLLNDFYLVLVDQVYESSTTKSGIITSNTAIINHEQEDRGEFKRRYGRVLEVPMCFSDTVVEAVDPGNPPPRTYVGHEHIKRMRDAGYRAGTRQYDHRVYYPGTFEKYDVVTCKDIAKRVDVNKGDIVYFREISTDVERHMGPYQGGQMFAVRVDEIHAVVKEAAVFEGYNAYKKRKIFPQGGWVFVQLNMETWEDITIPIPGQAQGIIAKVAPEALPLQGKVLHAQRKQLEGKNVIFHRDADAPITVDGKEMTVMVEDDILAIIKP
jgi:co-chaperonin GroES (HSP10)